MTQATLKEVLADVNELFRLLPAEARIKVLREKIKADLIALGYNKGVNVEAGSVTVDYVESLTITPSIALDVLGRDRCKLVTQTRVSVCNDLVKANIKAGKISADEAELLRSKGEVKRVARLRVASKGG